jgi:hypothetical protein
MTVFWDVTPCSLVEIYRRLRGTLEAVHISETSDNFYNAARNHRIWPFLAMQISLFKVDEIVTKQRPGIVRMNTRVCSSLTLTRRADMRLQRHARPSCTVSLLVPGYCSNAGYYLTCDDLSKFTQDCFEST